MLLTEKKNSKSIIVYIYYLIEIATPPKKKKDYECVVYGFGWELFLSPRFILVPTIPN